MNAVGVALDARAILAKGWTQASDDTEALISARDAEGRPCGALARQAVRFTLIGALLKATNADKRSPQSIAVYEALQQHLGESPVGWSNAVGRRQAEVVAAFDGVIAALTPAEVAGG